MERFKLLALKLHAMSHTHTVPVSLRQAQSYTFDPDTEMGQVE